MHQFERKLLVAVEIRNRSRSQCNPIIGESLPIRVIENYVFSVNILISTAMETHHRGCQIAKNRRRSVTPFWFYSEYAKKEVSKTNLSCIAKLTDVANFWGDDFEIEWSICKEFNHIMIPSDMTRVMSLPDTSVVHKEHGPKLQRAILLIEYRKELRLRHEGNYNHHKTFKWGKINQQITSSRNSLAAYAIRRPSQFP